jgi:sec-independent protein translocase protein TatA
LAGLIGWPELILILIIVIFIFGAGRITELAKALGRGVKDYKDATQEPVKDDDDAVKEAARKMGISTEGKTTSQIIEEMKTKTSLK